MALIILAIIGFILNIIWAVLAIILDKEYVRIKLAYYITSVLLFILSVLCIVVYYENKPTAMDVYRGKTTLEITYRDKVPVDTVVVLKK